MIEGPLDSLIDFLLNRLPLVVAKTLTQTIREAQAAVIDNLPRELTVRSEWYRPTNRYGIHATFATRGNLSAQLDTAAWWLAKTETGETHSPIAGHEIAVPSYGVQPDPKQLVPRALYPRALGNKAVFITAKDGREFIFIRTGPGPRDMKLAYVLQPKVARPRHEVVTKPAVETIGKRLGPNFNENLAAALT